MRIGNSPKAMAITAALCFGLGTAVAQEIAGGAAT